MTLPALMKLFAPLDAERLHSLTASCGMHEAERALLHAAVVATPPVLLRDGGVIAKGYDAELDELRTIATNANQYLTDLETRERERTRIPNLQRRLQPRARLLHRDHEFARGVRAGRLHAPPNLERRRTLHHGRAQGLRGQGALRERARARARKTFVRRRAREARRVARRAAARPQPASPSSMRS